MSACPHRRCATIFTIYGTEEKWAVTNAANRRIARGRKKLKGRRAFARRLSEHGQRPDAPARKTLKSLSLSSPERTEPTPYLTHETSDHLLSLLNTRQL